MCVVFFKGGGGSCLYAVCNHCIEFVLGFLCVSDNVQRRELVTFTGHSNILFIITTTIIKSPRDTAIYYLLFLLLL